MRDLLDSLVPLRDKLFQELDHAQRHALDTQEMVEPTKDERRNGWTAETLTKYLAGRRAGQTLDIDPMSLQRRLARRPQRQNSKYNPHRWRRS